jgi:hypothetical protein
MMVVVSGVAEFKGAAASQMNEGKLKLKLIVDDTI